MMLQLKESKQLVKPTATVHYNPFDVQLLTSTDKTKLFTVELDPMNHLIYLTIILDDQSLMITLSADQSVTLGQWCLEAGHIINFVDKANIEFEEIEDKE